MILLPRMRRRAITVTCTEYKNITVDSRNPDIIWVFYVGPIVARKQQAQTQQQLSLQDDLDVLEI